MTRTFIFKRLPAAALAATLAAALAATLTGCGEAADVTAPADPAAMAREAISLAEDRQQASADVGHAWHQPIVLIGAAREALEAGDYETAIEQADRATAMAEAAVAQAEAERTAWRHRPPFAS
jgi:hypothetical protein